MGKTKQGKNDLRPQLELIRDRCTIKVYHPELPKNIDKFIESSNSYFSAKQNLINLQGQGTTPAQSCQHFESTKEKFGLCTKEIESFIDSLPKQAAVSQFNF